LIEAMAKSIEREGYRQTSVADVVRIARVSRRAFYEHFADRDACFLALFDATFDRLIERIAAAVRSGARWDEQVDVAVGAYIDGVAERPGLWESFAREVPGLGRAGVEHEQEVVERIATMLVALVESGRREQADVIARPLTLDMAIVIVVGLRELTITALERGRDLEEFRAAATGIVKTILDAAVLRR
jgi:AcrR family transcriptional regulator